MQCGEIPDSGGEGHALDQACFFLRRGRPLSFQGLWQPKVVKRGLERTQSGSGFQLQHLVGNSAIWGTIIIRSSIRSYGFKSESGRSEHVRRELVSENEINVPTAAAASSRPFRESA